MSNIDIFGNIVDASTVEGHVRAALMGPDPDDLTKGWLVHHLAHQERRWDLDPGYLPYPRSWTTVSDFDIEAHDQLPAVIIVSPGTAGGTRDQNGAYEVIWRIELGVVIAGKDEGEGRFLASLYLAAVKGALIQDRSLGGTVQYCRWVPGSDDHAFGFTQRGNDPRAIYGTAFEVTIADAINDTRGPTEPPDDPYDPPDMPERQRTADIDVTSHPLPDPFDA